MILGAEMGEGEGGRWKKCNLWWIGGFGVWGFSRSSGDSGSPVCSVLSGTCLVSRVCLENLMALGISST